MVNHHIGVKIATLFFYRKLFKVLIINYFMVESSDSKKSKSFNLKKENAEKIENIAFEEKRRQSSVVDEMVEEFDGNRQ